MKRGKNSTIWIAGLTVLAFLSISDMLTGGLTPDTKIIWMLRMPRVMTAMIAGGALALSGAQMQSTLRNPLADPHIMGISAGAALGAAVATMSGWSSGITIAAAAFAGALATSLIILPASRKFTSASTLLIFGVMLGFIFNAIVSILQFSTDAESLKIFYSWSAGSFSMTGWDDILIMTVALAIGHAASMYNSKGLDIMLFGDEFASMAGADVRRIRLGAVMNCCLMTGAVTAFCGPLGFVGIVAPHMARALMRTSSHRIILPVSLLTGSAIGVTADILSRISDHPIPVASTMAMIGIPVIIYIMVRKSPRL